LKTAHLQPTHKDYWIFRKITFQLLQKFTRHRFPTTAQSSPVLKPYITQNEVETKTTMDLKGTQKPVLLKNLLLFKENVVSSTPQSCLSGHEPSFIPTLQLKPEEKLLRNPVLKRWH
jgi:hypothetical protein